MRNFSVKSGVSEPAAYAACALQEFGLEPDSNGNNKLYYAVFDFGGGTTDFDFGSWSLSDSTRYDYVLTCFGSGGDGYRCNISYRL